MKTIKSAFVWMLLVLLVACQKDDEVAIPSVSFKSFILNENGDVKDEVKDGGLIEVNVLEDVYFKFTGDAGVVSIWPGDSVVASNVDVISHNYEAFLSSGGDVRKYNGFSLKPGNDDADYSYQYQLPGEYKVYVIGSNAANNGQDVKKELASITVKVVDESAYYNSFSAFGITQLGLKYINQKYNADQSENKLSFTLPGGVDLSSVIADFTVAQGTKVYVGDVLQESRKTRNDYTQPVTYRLVSPRGNESTMDVEIKLLPLETGTEILSYKIAETNTESVIDQTSRTISFYLDYLPDELGRMSYTGIFETSPNVYIANQRGQQQFSGVTKNDFLSTVMYSLISEDDQNIGFYTISVEVGPGIASISMPELSPSPTIMMNHRERKASFEVLKETDLTNFKFTLSASTSGSTFKVVSEKGEEVDKPFISGQTTVNISEEPVSIMVTDLKDRSVIYKIFAIVVGS